MVQLLGDELVMNGQADAREKRKNRQQILQPPETHLTTSGSSYSTGVSSMGYFAPLAKHFNVTPTTALTTNGRNHQRRPDLRAILLLRLLLLFINEIRLGRVDTSNHLPPVDSLSPLSICEACFISHRHRKLLPPSAKEQT